MFISYALCFKNSLEIVNHNKYDAMFNLYKPIHVLSCRTESIIIHLGNVETIFLSK